MRYPCADRLDWYGQANYEDAGGVIVAMPPETFLSAVRPLRMDEESLENVDILSGHMTSGGTLDPLVIFDDGMEDGRHRANAAISLGMETVPVILFGRQIARFPDLPRWESADSPEGP